MIGSPRGFVVATPGARVSSAGWAFWGGAGLLGVILMAAAAVYVTPALQAVNNGIGYQALADNPFDFSRPLMLRSWDERERIQYRDMMRLRILTPLVAHYLYFRGPAYIFFPLLVGVLFLAAVYIHARRQGFGGAEALGMAGLMAFTTPILFHLHFQGYTDTTTYLLLFLTLVFAGRWWLWPIFFALAILNHHSSPFLAPLLLLSPRRRTHWLATVLLLGLSVVPFYLYHQWARVHAGNLLDETLYLSRDHIRFTVNSVAQYLPLGAFEAFKPAWAFPLIAIAYLLQTRRWRYALFLAAAIVLAMLQMLFVWDTSRHISLIAFVAVLFGAEVVREKWGAPRFVRTLWVLIGFNFLVPQYYIGQATAYPFYPLPVSLILRFVFGIDAWDLWWK